MAEFRVPSIGEIADIVYGDVDPAIAENITYSEVQKILGQLSIARDRGDVETEEGYVIQLGTIYSVRPDLRPSQRDQEQ